MVLYVIFTDSIKTKYKTSVCSKASLVIFFINFLMFVIPLLIAYRTHGFWLKSHSYQEQPDVHFMYEYFLMLETDRPEVPVICTTFNALMEAASTFDNCPIIKVREVDDNKDGRNDKLLFQAEALIGAQDNVYAATIIFLLNYKLYSYTRFEMESLGWIETSSGVGGGSLSIVGDLRIKQRQLLRNKGNDFRYNNSIVTANYSHEFDLYSLLNSYTKRNITTYIDNIYTVWKRGRDKEQPFTLTVELLYPEDTIMYRPGTWHVFKLAWVQYLALLYISVLIGRRVKHFVLDYRLVHNVKEGPWKKMF